MNHAQAYSAKGCSRLGSLAACAIVLLWANSLWGQDKVIEHSQALWLDAQTIAWPGAPATGQYELLVSAEATLKMESGQLTGDTSIPLVVRETGLAPALAGRYPHLAKATVLQVPDLSDLRLRTLLMGQLAVRSNAGLATGVQLPGIIDQLFPYDGPLGVTFDGTVPTIRVWAPTARSVSLIRFDNDPGEPLRTPMYRDSGTGVWSLTGKSDWNRQRYRFEVTVYHPETQSFERNEVTDPYALGLTTNSEYGLIVNLDDPELMPTGWDSLSKPAGGEAVDKVIYELHLRDFSILDEGVPAQERGTFRAFRHKDSLGMQHLSALQAAGVSDIHLLPVFDIATVPERREDRFEVDRQLLGTFPADSSEPQKLVAAARGEDGFNWGYDPYHYTVPEGSYSTDPEGVARITEFREMVAALNETGLRVIMDVVYNHTHASGRQRGSVLDQLVPGYYQRLNADGLVETSTCCANTATEHAMMEKLMVDSVLTWARDYRVDGFRFDLMGHHSRSNMLRLRAALDALTLEKDGIDGASIFLYGEGWNFGEVANDARFIQARQGQLAGTGIGTFSDRLRDGARGGGHIAHPKTQGFLNGLAIDPNAWSINQGNQDGNLQRDTDWIRVGLAADLADYQFETAAGTALPASAIDYNGAPAGYTADPAENISYVAAHDNETLFDINQMRLPVSTPMANRVQVQTLANALVLLGQGVPFIHAGQEFLRSKSLDRNSYDSGDWYNAIDWSFAGSNWGHGLPLATENENHWDLMKPLLANPALAPDENDRRQALADFSDLLRIRKSSRLFRLRDKASIQRHLRFHNTGLAQQPGLIVMSLSDPDGKQKDEYSHHLVFFNAQPEATQFELPQFAELPLEPHPNQPQRMAGRQHGDAFTIPPRSVSIFSARHE